MTERKNSLRSARPTLLAGAGLAVLSLACGAPASNGSADSAEVVVAAEEAAVEAEATAQSKTRIRIVGVGNVATSVRPLVYVDGVRVDRGEASQNDVLSALDPSTIARIEVLKGPAAEELYGEEASNGVIQIFLNEEEDADKVREALGKVLSGIGEGISRTGEGIKKAGERIRKK